MHFLMLHFRNVLNFLVPFTKSSAEIVHAVWNFMFHFSVQQETKDVIQGCVVSSV